MADKTVVVRLALKAGGFSTGLKKAGADVQDFGVQVERGATKAGSSALALGAASATAGKLIILGIGGAMVVSAKAAIDYESSLIGVAKTTDLAGSAFDRASGPLASFGDRLRELSLRIPVNVNDLARIAELGGQLGIEVPNLVNFTETIAALGVTTNLSTERAATSLARIANIMGTSQSDFARMGGIIVELGNNFATTEAEIVNFATRIAPALKAVGGTEEDLFALSAALTSLGVPAERGGTALQRFFIEVAKAVDTGGDKLRGFAETSGQTIEEFTQTFRDSPADAFAAFVKGLNNVQEAGGSVFQTLKDLDIQEQRSIQVLLAASNGWETVADAIESARIEGEKAGDALFEEAARRYGSTASQIQILANAFNDLRIEIGSALLGSGGLTASVDAFREFFGIVKDNLPLIGRLAQIMGVLAAIRLGASFLTMAAGMADLIGKFKAAKTAAEGMSRSMAAARLAALGLNTAIFGALAIVGILATKWAMAAVKAAELKTAARELNEALKVSDDPYATVAQSLEEQQILTEGVKEALQDAGLSQEAFIDDLLQGGGKVNKVLEDQIKLYGILQESEPGSDRFLEVQQSIEDIQQLLGPGNDLLDQFFRVRRNELVDALLGAGFGAEKTTEELRAMADQALRFFGFNITDSDLMMLLTPQTAEGGGIGHRVKSEVEAAKAALGDWRKLMMSREGGEDIISGFGEDLESGVEDFNTFLSESFNEINDTIRGGFPAWDEYEHTTIESLDAVIAAQDKYLLDLRAGFDFQDQLVSGAFGELTPETVEWFKALDAGTKAALGRMDASSLQSFIDDVDDNFRQMNNIVRERLLRELPAIGGQGISSMIEEMMGLVDDLGLTGAAQVDAFREGAEFQLASLPEKLRPIYAAQVLEAFTGQGGLLDSIGFDATDPLIAGWIRGLERLAGMSTAPLEGEFTELQEKMWRKWEAKSPSKVTMRLGHDVAEGFKVGLEGRLAEFGAANLFSDFMPFAAPSTSTSTSTVSNSRSVTIEVNNPRTNDLKTDLQYGGLMASQVVIAN